MYPRSMADSDCVVIQGSNMAECHPVAFRWPMQAKLKGAKLIHVDPRFTRTSAVADIHAPIRAGSDVAFLGGLIRYVLESERWRGDSFFREFVVNYTNAATIVGDGFKDTEDVDGVFSGLMQYAPGIKEWPLDERLVAGLLHQSCHAVDRAIEVPHLPLGCAGSAVEHLGRAIRVHVKLVDRRTLGAQRPLVVRAAWIALDVDDPPLDGMNQRGAPD